MSMYGKDYEYANSRLVETIVRRAGVPIFVVSVNRGMVVYYYNLDEMDGDLKTCDIDELDLHPVPLGYCNFNKYATYLSRIPMRRDWRQGLRKGNFTSQGAGYPGERIPYEALSQVIIGDYPAYKACLDAVLKVKSMAWARHWSVDNALDVFYKGGRNPVGKVEEGNVILIPSFSYLKEALQESL